MRGRGHAGGQVGVRRGSATAETVGASVLSDHVRVNLDSDVSGAWRDCADVLYGTGEPAMATRLLEAHPGCLLASVRDREDGRCTAAARDGVRIEASWVRDERDHALVVSALYRLLVDLGRVVKVPSGSRRPARTLAALSESPEYAQYANDPPPCDRTHQTP